ncbi:cytochrome C [Hydrogenovibrio sp. SC-1]|nr:cytochrome C [Hydrogenovibrio sp. SC-1]
MTESVTDSVTETVEETYEKAKSLSAAEAAPMLLAENATAGVDLYKSCVGCHGAKGEGGVGPRLAGRDAEQMIANLKTYREGGQVGPMSSLMTPYVKNLSDTDLKTMVDYISQF